jgi:hypothetical protein
LNFQDDDETEEERVLMNTLFTALVFVAVLVIIVTASIAGKGGSPDTRPITAAALTTPAAPAHSR